MTDIKKAIKQAVKSQEAVEKAIEKKDFFRKAWVKKR